MRGALMRKKMAKIKKLSERTDEAGEMTRQMVSNMFEKIFALKAMKTQLARNQKKELDKVRRKFAMDLEHIEQDIYKFENAIKKITGSNEFHSMSAQFKRELKVRKEVEKQKKAEQEKSLEVIQDETAQM
jgi:hypothetical protein